MRLSIVTSLYGSEPYLRELYERCVAAASAMTDSFELVLVNDASPDGSLAAALELHRTDPRVRVIDLARNFGQHKALLTGLAHARGEIVFCLDSDLEEDPAWLELFHARMLESGADVAYGVQRRRKGRWFERLTGSVYYAIFRLLSSYPVPANQTAARLMTRRYVQALVAHRDQEVFLAGLWAITGFQQVPVSVEKRDKGSSSYDVRKKLRILVSSVTSFSNAPLVFIFWLGMAVTAVSVSAALGTLVAKLFFIDFELGWPSLIISLWLLSGLTFCCLGVIGMYLSKIFTETKDRPYTIIRDVYDRFEESA